MSSFKKKFLQGAWAALLNLTLGAYIIAILAITTIIYAQLAYRIGLTNSAPSTLLYLLILLTGGGVIASSMFSFIVLGFFWQIPKEGRYQKKKANFI